MTKRVILIVAAMLPFALSCIPTAYVLLVYYFQFTYLISFASGIAWMVLFVMIHQRSEARERRSLRWYLFLAPFAFVVPVHLILTALGAPPFLPDHFTPS
jgi:hypothetical protein